MLPAMTGWSSLPFLGLIRQPTLVMGGDDLIVPVANPVIERFLSERAQPDGGD